ncbi:MAG: T9SS type A sorting domain-containing protein [Candidatus Cloacimonadota bacterium]|jgi:hypothetical protein|nr:T9SS type A sorting domain-containing protein [Candidatus Cloacimonadota bacterium]
MKRYIVLSLILFAGLTLSAEERLVFIHTSTTEITSPYFLAEVDSVLNLYSYSETDGMMQILKRSHSSYSGEVSSQVIWQQALPPNLTSPLLYHKGERIYGKLWVYIHHADWLGAISLDDAGNAQFHQLNVPGSATDFFILRRLQHFGEGHIYFFANTDLKHWELAANQANTVVQVPGIDYEFERLGNEYLLISGVDHNVPFHTYLLDSGHNLIQTNLVNWEFWTTYRFQEGLYYTDYSCPDEMGTGSIMINNGNIDLVTWSLYGEWHPNTFRIHPILSLPDSLYLFVYTSTPYDEPPSSGFVIKRYNGANSFSNYSGFPATTESALSVNATFFANKLLLMGWQSPGFFARLADLDSQAWIQVDFSEDPSYSLTYPSIYNNDEAIWFIFERYEGTELLKSYRGDFCVANDDPLAPQPQVLTLYPNPARSQGLLKLESDAPTSSVKLYNLRGQYLKDLSLVSQASNEYRLPELSAGIYLLRITDAYQRTSHKKLLIRD